MLVQGNPLGRVGKGVWPVGMSQIPPVPTGAADGGHGAIGSSLSIWPCQAPLPTLRKTPAAPGLLVNTVLRQPLHLLRPRHALMAERHRADTLVVELLHPLTLVGFGGVDVPLRIRGDAVHAVELARLTPAVA